jgi:rare lipoprotein A
MRATLLAAALLCVAAATARAGDVASCYGPESGLRTASGERFDWRCPKGECTAAHRTLPFGTYVRVTYLGRAVVVKINDRGPFVKGRTIDLSLGACRRIGLEGVGVGPVELDVLAGAPFRPAGNDLFRGTL